MQSLETWRLWCQIFLAQTLIGDTSLFLACLAYNANGQQDAFFNLFKQGRPIRSHPLHADIVQLLGSADQILNDYERSQFCDGTLAASRLSEQLKALTNMPKGII